MRQVPCTWRCGNYLGKTGTGSRVAQRCAYSALLCGPSTIPCGFMCPCSGGDPHFRLKSRGGALKGAHLLATCLWLKQSAKASLLKVAVAGERFQEVALLHDDEADAVDCSPLFIRALTIKLPAFSAQLGSQLNNLDALGVLDALQQTARQWAEGNGRKPIAHFQQNDRGSHESSTLIKPLLEKPHGLLMQAVVSIHQRDPAGGVNKSEAARRRTHDCLDWPYR